MISLLKSLSPLQWVTVSVVAVLLIAVGVQTTRLANDHTEIAEIRTKHAEELVAGVQAARAQEHLQQEKVNETLRKQYADLSAVNNRLNAELGRLRNRPERPADVSEAPRPACAGANGPELARVYAEFLTRYAARAAEQDADLAACYGHADAVEPP